MSLFSCCQTWGYVLKIFYRLLSKTHASLAVWTYLKCVSDKLHFLWTCGKGGTEKNSSNYSISYGLMCFKWHIQRLVQTLMVQHWHSLLVFAMRGSSLQILQTRNDCFLLEVVHLAEYSDSACIACIFASGTFALLLDQISRQLLSIGAEQWMASQQAGCKEAIMIILRRGQQRLLNGWTEYADVSTGLLCAGMLSLALCDFAPFWK